MCTSKMQKNPYENVIAVTNRSLCQRPFAEQIERVCSLHPKAVILREKDLPEEEYSRLTEQILEICKRYQVPCILHTYVNVAEKLHHPYIHLPIFLLEKYEGKLGGFRQIGSSVHSVEDALKAESLGADYLTAGHIYTTDCKKGLPPRGLEFLVFYYTREALGEVAPRIADFAEREGLHAHAKSVTIRYEED